MNGDSITLRDRNEEKCQVREKVETKVSACFFALLLDYFCISGGLMSGNTVEERG